MSQSDRGQDAVDNWEDTEVTLSKWRAIPLCFSDQETQVDEELTPAEQTKIKKEPSFHSIKLPAVDFFHRSCFIKLLSRRQPGESYPRQVLRNPGR